MIYSYSYYFSNKPEQGGCFSTPNTPLYPPVDSELLRGGLISAWQKTPAQLELRPKQLFESFHT